MGGKITHRTSMFMVSIATCQKIQQFPVVMPTVPTVAGVLDADKRSGCEAVEHRTAWRPSTKGTPPARGSSWLVLPTNICVQCSIPIKALLSLHFFQHSPFLNPCVRVLNSVFQAFQAVSQIFINNLKHHPI